MLGKSTSAYCSFGGCGKAVVALGLCSGHYKQHRKGWELRPLRKQRPSGVLLARWEEGIKQCGKCGRERPLDEFNVDNRRSDGLQAYCKSCQAEWHALYYAENTERLNVGRKAWYESGGSDIARAGWLKSNYKLSVSDYVGMLESQGGTCANSACSRNPVDGKRLVVDHDHACCPGKKSCGKCVRQLLCDSCNKVLGWVDDDTSMLRGLIAYLERHSTHD